MGRAPRRGSGGKRPPDVLIEAIVEQVNASRFFGEVVVRRYPWSERYTADQYMRLLNTYSDHRSLAEDTKDYLFTGVRQVNDRLGGVVDRPYLAVLYLARKREVGD